MLWSIGCRWRGGAGSRGSDGPWCCGQSSPDGGHAIHFPHSPLDDIVIYQILLLVVI